MLQLIAILSLIIATGLALTYAHDKVEAWWNRG
jgi:hypothetical protein